MTLKQLEEKLVFLPHDFGHLDREVLSAANDSRIFFLASGENAETLCILDSKPPLEALTQV
jgi:hypothetical protein